MPNKVNRVKTNYPGVYFIMGKATDGRPERIFYIFYRKAGKQIEEKAGRQYVDKMTPARAARIEPSALRGGQAIRSAGRRPGKRYGPLPACGKSTAPPSP